MYGHPFMVAEMARAFAPSNARAYNLYFWQHARQADLFSGER